MSHLRHIPFSNPTSWTPFSAPSQDMMQKTVGAFFMCRGVGVHSGNPVNLRVSPAPAGFGIVFTRSDLGGKEVVAHWQSVVDTRNCTTIGNSEGVTISTIEHLMAAFAAYGIDNARVDIDGPELPIMDGSSTPFVESIEAVGVRTLKAPRRVIRVLKEVVYEEEGRWISLSPSTDYTLDITFESDRITSQNARCVFRPLVDDFAFDIAGARTFGLLEDAEKIKALGLAKGASLENTVVFQGEVPLNAEGLRYADECVRHKVLDAVGDLHLAGGLLLATVRGHQIGHAMNHKALLALFSDPSAWRVERG